MGIEQKKSAQKRPSWELYDPQQSIEEIWLPQK